MSLNDGSQPTNLPQGHPQSTTNAHAQKLDLIFYRFFIKFLLIIAASRSTAVSEGPRSSRTDKWFNLETPDTDIHRDHIRAFRTISALNSLPSLTLHCVLLIPEIGTRRALVALDTLDGPLRIEPTPRAVLLETWTLTASPSSGSSLSESISSSESEGTSLAVIYKHAISLFRSLYTLCHQLPAAKLFQRYRQQAGASPDSQAFGIELRLQLDNSVLAFDAFPAPSWPIPLSTSTHAFPTLPTSLVSFNIVVRYLSRPIFQIDTLASIISNVLFNQDADRMSKSKRFTLAQRQHDSATLSPGSGSMVMQTSRILPQPGQHYTRNISSPEPSGSITPLRRPQQDRDVPGSGSSLAQDDGQNETTPANSVHHHSISRSYNESNPSNRSVGFAGGSGQSTLHVPVELVHISEESFELEKLMQEKIPLDLTGEVLIEGFQRPKDGGFALVYKGVWKGRDVAVKTLKATKNVKKPAPWEASMQRRLNREINVWAALSHPNIAEFLGFTEGFGDFPAMISTWCHAGTVRDYLNDDEDMAIEIRIRLVQDVADGLQYLHRLKIIHGDLKPTNVLVDDNHVARLCDFGLVRLDDWQGPIGMTTTSPYTGTERYKAPELFITIDNRHPLATCEGDIWAFGCITFEFIESKVPYERYSHSIDLAKAISDGEPPAPRPNVPEPTNLFSQHLWYLLEGCWTWYPENRVKVNQVVEELAQLSELLVGK